MQDALFHEQMHGSIFKLHYGHVYNGNPSQCDNCAISLAFDDLMYEKKIPCSIESDLDHVVIYHGHERTHILFSKAVYVFANEEYDGEFIGVHSKEQFAERTLRIHYMADADKPYLCVDFVDPDNPDTEFKDFEPANAMRIDILYAPSHEA